MYTAGRTCAVHLYALFVPKATSGGHLVDRPEAAAAYACTRTYLTPVIYLQVHNTGALFHNSCNYHNKYGNLFKLLHNMTPVLIHSTRHCRCTILVEFAQLVLVSPHLVPLRFLDAILFNMKQFLAETHPSAITKYDEEQSCIWSTL